MVATMLKQVLTMKHSHFLTLLELIVFQSNFSTEIHRILVPYPFHSICSAILLVLSLLVASNSSFFREEQVEADSMRISQSNFSMRVALKLIEPNRRQSQLRRS